MELSRSNNRSDPLLSRPIHLEQENFIHLDPRSFCQDNSTDLK